ncbi:hemerythrin-like metal-binding protein [Magnetococcus marinus MC-1]|uniref:Hemerythrin-like metal-binding protein n=1 Tax=Magnetococcus marinus (strain ATCC BAA-1437 / JCM 17883 / MC-1) TaxID=156889 RepID=A0LBI4_MAGMM|nr:hemerythrin domain-containing protein [Magnetococcus marinus]ABK45327.1 hemerythrin-like metal-binding protein [Magnetococcus marinus MC-1]
MSDLIIPCKSGTLNFEQDLKLNVPSIDKQHEQLFLLAIGVSHAIQAGADEESIRVSALELEAYVQEHLSFEERLLASNNYPQLNSHKLAHSRFVKTNSELQKSLESCSAGTCIKQAPKLFDMLTEWLSDHILRVDRMAVDFMTSNEVAPKPRNARFKLSGRALIEFEGGGGMTGRLENISQSSLFLHIPPPIPAWIKEKTKAKIQLMPLDQKNSRPCTVIRIEPERGIALEITGQLSTSNIYQIAQQTP